MEVKVRGLDRQIISIIDKEAKKNNKSRESYLRDLITISTLTNTSIMETNLNEFSQYLIQNFHKDVELTVQKTMQPLIARFEEVINQNIKQLNDIKKLMSD